MEDALILMVDDDRNLRRLYENHLKSAGFKVIQAESGEEAVRTLSETVPDLILLDVQMGGMDGFETIEAIRKIPGLLNVPVLFLTSAADPEIKVRGLLSDADDYILKSTPKEELIARIKAAIKRTNRFHQTAGQGHMAGHLSNMPLADLLQSMGNARQTASVGFEQMEANLYVEDGTIIHVTKGEFSGQEALTRMFFEEKGPFLVLYDQLPDDIPKNPIPIMSALMNVTAYVDEVMEYVRRNHLDTRHANIDYELAEYTEFKDFRDESPIHCLDLLSRMRGTLKQNLKALIEAVKEKEIYLVTTTI